MKTLEDIESGNYSTHDICVLFKRAKDMENALLLIRNTYHGINGVTKAECINSIYETAENVLQLIKN